MNKIPYTYEPTQNGHGVEKVTPKTDYHLGERII